MTDPNRARSDDENWLLNQLHDDAAASADDPELPEDLTDDEQWALDELADLNIDYPAVVQAAVDRLIPAAPVRPEARARFLAAADRALAVRRADLGPLPVVLAAVRKRAEMSVESIQAHLDQAGEHLQVTDLETGRITLRDAGKKATALWIRALPIQRDRALDAARRSLDADLRGALRPAAGQRSAGNTTDEWIIELIVELDSLAEETP